MGRGITKAEKTLWRDLIIRGDPFSEDESAGILDYCETDVVAMAALLPRMLPAIVGDGLPYALLRGRYMKASARMEFAGVPLDVELLAQLKHHWPEIEDELIERVDRDFGVYGKRTFKQSLFVRLLAKLKIPWILLESAAKPGTLDLSDDAFKEMALRHPELAPLKELRADLSAMRLIDLTVGKDGRNRTILSAFSARTSRNQPSNSRYIFGPSVFLRGLIRSEPGFALAYIDYCQ